VNTNNFITSWLQVESIELKYSDSTEATEKIHEDCCPGIPYIVFSVYPSISLTLINPQPQSGHFTRIVSVRDGDNVARLAAQLTRADHLIKGMKLFDDYFAVFFLYLLIIKYDFCVERVHYMCTVITNRRFGHICEWNITLTLVVDIIV
jgi:hypothetical protein